MSLRRRRGGHDTGVSKQVLYEQTEGPCELYISEIVEKASDGSIANGELDVIGECLSETLEVKQIYLNLGYISNTKKVY